MGRNSLSLWLNCKKPTEGNGIKWGKAKHRPSLTPKEKKTRLQWAKEELSWTVGDWMEVIFSDESTIYFEQGDNAGALVWCRSNETNKINVWRKQANVHNHWWYGLMSGKEPGDDRHNCYSECSEMLDTFLIPSVQRRFGDAKVIFQDDNTSCYRTKQV